MLSECSYPERSNCLRQKFGIRFCGAPVVGNHGDQGSVHESKVVYTELQLTSYREIWVRFVLPLSVFGVAVLRSVERCIALIFVRRNHSKVFKYIFIALTGNAARRSKIAEFGRCLVNTKVKGVVRVGLFFGY